MLNFIKQHLKCLETQAPQVKILILHLKALMEPQNFMDIGLQKFIKCIIYLRAQLFF